MRAFLGCTGKSYLSSVVSFTRPDTAFCNHLTRLPQATLLSIPVVLTDRAYEL
jgi:hypothetical protein